MSLLRVSALRAAEGSPGGSPPGWLPSHVQVTVGAARGLRLKGGPADAFAVLQLGRQKHRTAVATLRAGGGTGTATGPGGPRWDEEVALELPPAGPEETDAAALLLQLTVWQRALVGLDRFLGRALLPLGPLLQAGRAHPPQWHRLHSKPGKKEKERGEIQVSLHFTRHSLTASMFDLSVKDKPRSPFGKLRDKMKGRRQYDLETASAIVPSSSGALEEDLGLGGKKAKGGGGGFFFKNRLRKSSLTQSSTSLGSDSTVSSASSMVGLGALEAGAAPSPSRHSSLPPDRSARDFLPSPKLTHKRAFSDEVSQITPLPESRSVQSLKPQSEPISRSSLCINGSHIYCEEPSSRPAGAPSSAAAAPLSRPKKPAEAFGTGPPDSELPPWSGSSGGGGFQRPPQKDPPRFIPSPPILAAQEEDKLSVKTLALSKQRSRARMEEGAPLPTEGKPVQVAPPMVFSADSGRGRPPEEAPKEEKRAKAGIFRRGSAKEDAGKSRGAESAAGPEGDKSGSWFSLKDPQDPSRRPSSQPGLLAATEVTKDTCVCEDRGPSAFLRAGTPQPESAPQSVSAFEPAAAAAAAGPPLEWGDPFDALATSRLRPGAPREPPLHWDAALEGLADRDQPEEDASPPYVSAGPPQRRPSEPEGSPGVAPEETLGGGEQPWDPCVESRPGQPPSGPWEEEALSGGSLDWEEAAAEAEAADPWGEAAWQASATLPGPPLPLGRAVESNASQESPPSSPTASGLGRAAVLLLGASLASQAETGEDASADVCRWDAARQEPAALRMPPAPGPQAAPGEGQLPEEEEEADQRGGRAEEGSSRPSESREQGGEGGQGAESAPPKPPRRFTPLSLEEEASEALWGARPRRESQEGPGVEADGQGGAPGVIGAGGGSVGRGAEGLLLPAADDGPAGANELTRQAAGPLGDSELATDAGAGGGEQLQTCPGKPGLAGVGGEPPSAPSSGLLGATQVLGPLPMAEEGPPGPSGPPPPGPELSPFLLFWTALEEQLLPSPEGASPEQPGGLSEGPSSREPGLEQGGGAALALPRGLLGQGPGDSVASDLELSSSWSDDRVVDFKKADFWQAERGEESGAPGNPFVSRVSPQNNPFVERPPGALPEAAPPGLLPAALSQDQPAAPFPHDNQPLAFSTPSLEEEEEEGGPASSSQFAFPSPIVHPAPGQGSGARGLLAARLCLALPSPNPDAAASSVSPTETRPADEVPVQQTTSPHLVKPTSRPVEKQRRSSLPLGQEKLKPKPTSSDDSATPILPLETTGLKRDPAPLDCSAKYFHLTHEELVQLLQKREAELSKKQEHIRELENYIDWLLVRIMEQSPTLLQIPRAAK